MKKRTLVADPYQFLAANVHTMSEAACLTHVGRCGFVGCPVSTLQDALRLPYNTITQCMDRLADKGLVKRYSRSNRKGRAYHWCASVDGWNLLTTEPDLNLFPYAVHKPAEQ